MVQVTEPQDAHDYSFQRIDVYPYGHINESYYNDRASDIRRPVLCGLRHTFGSKRIQNAASYEARLRLPTAEGRPDFVHGL